MSAVKPAPWSVRLVAQPSPVPSGQIVCTHMAATRMCGCTSVAPFDDQW